MNFLYQFQLHLVLEGVVLDNPINVLEGHGGIFSCARLCLPPCRSLFYHKGGRQCILSNKIFDQDHSSLKTVEGWNYFIKIWSSRPCADIQYRQLTSVAMCIKFVTSDISYYYGKALCEAEPGGRVVSLDTKAKIATVETIHRTEYGVEHTGHDVFSITRHLKDSLTLFDHIHFTPGTGRWKFYIGLTREGKSDFKWTGGALLTDANWAPTQPTKNPGDYCVVSTAWLNYKWDDVFCTDKCGVICEVVF